MRMILNIIRRLNIINILLIRNNNDHTTTNNKHKKHIIVMLRITRIIVRIPIIRHIGRLLRQRLRRGTIRTLLIIRLRTNNK